MINLDDLNKIRSKKVSALGSARERERQRLLVEHRRQITSLGEKYFGLEQQINAEYHLKAARKVLEQLETDSSILASRAEFTEVTVGDLAVAAKFREVLKDVPDEKTKARLIDLYQNSSSESSHLGPALNLLSRTENMGEIKVHSYIAPFNSKDRQFAYLVLPVSKKQNDKLGEALESKVMDRLIREEATVGTTGVLEGSLVVRSATGQIEFIAKEGTAQNFVLYEIETKNHQKDAITPLVQCLASDLQQLQPEEFKKVRLTHEVIEVEPGILEALVKNTHMQFYIEREKLSAFLSQGIEYIPINQASEITGRSYQTLHHWAKNRNYFNSEKKVSVKGLLEFEQRHSKAKPDHSRNKNELDLEQTQKIAEARQRLARYESSQLSYKQICEVLAIEKGPAWSLAAKMSDSNIPEAYRWCKTRIGKEDYVPAEALDNFLKKARPTSVGWKFITD